MDHRSGGSRVVRRWLPTLVLNVALPAATYALLSGRGVQPVTALSVSAAWPLFELLYTVTKRRHADELSAIVLAFLVIGVVATLAFNNPRLLFVKDSAMTGLFGVVLLGSLAAPRPLMFYFGRRFATDGSAEQASRWNWLWQFAEFRYAQRVLTVVWGIVFLIEAGVRLLLTQVLSLSTMVFVTNVIPYAVVAALTMWTVRYGNSQRRSMEQSLQTAPATGLATP
ncbi:MAG: hypothetical protein JOY80_00590 [Candidatus Dormibacteraeota bacterium]|nr:hypothetical protein [Candidatus Dormibacteraeota bacterium]